MRWLEENRSGSPFYSSLSLSQVAKKKKCLWNYSGALQGHSQGNTQPLSALRGEQHAEPGHCGGRLPLGVTQRKSQPGEDRDFLSDVFPWEALLLLHVDESVAFDSSVTKGAGGKETGEH